MTFDVSSPSWCSPPLDFGNPVAEEQAARNGAALFDLTGRTHLSFTGRDRVRFLHGFCTNDIKKLPVGQGCEAFVTNVKGRILEHLFVWAEEDVLHVEATPGREEALFQHLDRYLITDDVQIARRSDELAELFLTGPNATPVLKAAGWTIELAANHHLRTAMDGVPISVRRMDLFGSSGYLLVVPRASSGPLRDQLVNAGALPAGRTVFEAMRIEAGLPLYGVDITDENLAQEASRTARCISFTKGCYLGQEPIARLDALGHVNKQLAGVRFDAEGQPAPGSSLKSGSGDEAGLLTSVAGMPSTGRAVALGMVKAKFAIPGTMVEAITETGTVSGAIVAVG